jgi:hypothetical protein
MEYLTCLQEELDHKMKDDAIVKLKKEIKWAEVSKFCSMMSTRLKNAYPVMPTVFTCSLNKS